MATLTTKLDAVNFMLQSVWHTPVNTLEVFTNPVVAFAVNVLDNANIQIQNKGWAFNTDENVKLLPDVNDNIVLPTNCLEVRAWGESKRLELVQRGDMLYDRENHTYTFENPVYVRIINLIEFEDLPQPFRSYIATYAKRVFKDEYTNAETATPPTREEMAALTAAIESDAHVGTNNMFNDSYSVSSILDRGPF